MFNAILNCLTWELNTMLDTQKTDQFDEWRRDTSGRVKHPSEMTMDGLQAHHDYRIGRGEHPSRLGY